MEAALHLAKRPQNIVDLERRVTDDLRSEIRSFVLAVRVATDFDEVVVGNWCDQLVVDLDDCVPQTPESSERAKNAIELLKRDFASAVVRPRAYQYLLRLWLSTIVALVAVYLFTGEYSVFALCDSPRAGHAIQDFCQATHGHFYGYISFRYAAFGVLIGTALLGSLSMAQGRSINSDGDTLLTRPMLRVVVALAIAYVLAALVASGKLSLNLLGFKIESDVLTRIIDGREVKQQGFRDAAALLVIGISAAFATEVYLSRFVEALRGGAQSIFPTPPNGDEAPTPN